MNSRQKNIIQILEREGEFTIKALTERLNVSEMTIHRDAEVLGAQRSLFKKRGALVYIENSDRNTTDDYLDEKRAIGLKVSSLIREGQSVIFDNSTTALECAKYLDPSGKYTFYATCRYMTQRRMENSQANICCFLFRTTKAVSIISDISMERRLFPKHTVECRGRIVRILRPRHLWTVRIARLFGHGCVTI